MSSTNLSAKGIGNESGIHQEQKVVDTPSIKRTSSHDSSINRTSSHDSLSDTPMCNIQYDTSTATAICELCAAADRGKQIVDNVNASFLYGDDPVRLSEGRRAINYWKSRLQKYTGQIASSLLPSIDAVSVSGLPSTVREQRRVLVEVSTLLEDRLKRHYDSIEAFCELLDSETNKFTWENLMLEAQTRIKNRHVQEEEESLECSTSSIPLPPIPAAAEVPLTPHSREQDSMSYKKTTTNISDVVSPSKPTTLNINNSNALKIKGNDALRNGQPQVAINFYTKALELSPNGPDSHIFFSNRAAAQMYLLHYKKAIFDCRAALRLKPRFAKAHARLGTAHYNLREFHNAITAYEKALVYDPSLISARTNLNAARNQLQHQNTRTKGNDKTTNKIPHVSDSNSSLNDFRDNLSDAFTHTTQKAVKWGENVYNKIMTDEPDYTSKSNDGNHHSKKSYEDLVYALESERKKRSELELENSRLRKIRIRK